MKMERKMVYAVATYQIEIQGQASEQVLNARSPLEITLVHVDHAATRFTLRADQSALVGLIRHLHGWGFVLLSIIRTP